MFKLPQVESPEKFEELNIREPAFLDAARAIYTNLGVTHLSVPASGSVPVVFGDNKYVLKFFPAVFVKEFEAEANALRYLSSQHMQVPKLLGTGEVDSWHYVLMSKLDGKSLKEWWPEVLPESRYKACFDIGKELKKIHNLPLSAEFDQNTWPKFLEKQTKSCVARHTRIGLREDLVVQIPAFLESVKLEHSGSSFLHTEVMRDHVLFSEELKFSGFIDFEPSMIGAPEYDFASVAVFVSSGDRDALRAFFEGYGNLQAASTKEFRRRILAYTLLHRYSNLKWYLQFMPGADTLDELADLWWAV